jgi:hypothetical protein
MAVNLNTSMIGIGGGGVQIYLPSPMTLLHTATSTGEYITGLNNYLSTVPFFATAIHCNPANK